MKAERSGFTLIELLIVIAIIGLLAAVGVPAYVGVMTHANRSACRSNLRGVGVAMRHYLHESGEVMPVAAQMPSLGLTEQPRIADVLARYLPGPRALRCPADREKDFFAREGSSYEYHSMLGGKRVDDSFLTQRWGQARTPVMNDYEPFHGAPGSAGAANYLFADGHVGDLE